MPEIGRLLAPEDVNLTAATPTQVAVLGYGFWQRHYAGARDIIGKTIKIEGLPFTIIGVTREEFTGISAVDPPEVTVPITAEPLFFRRFRCTEVLASARFTLARSGGPSEAGGNPRTGSRTARITLAGYSSSISADRSNPAGTQPFLFPAAQNRIRCKRRIASAQSFL